MTVKLELRPAEQEIKDAQRVMAWRNDPTTLAMSFDTAAKEWGTFWPEYEGTYFVQACPQPQFAIHNGTEVGFLRFRPYAELPSAELPCCDISINMNPAFRGHGLAVPCLRAAEAYLREQGMQTIVAEIKPGNTLSQYVFTKAGYEALGPYEKLLPRLGKSVEVYRYQRLAGIT
jgi:RimJ/RimL family protein N-acetyltransferase